MTPTCISLEVATTNALIPLGLEVWIDQECILDTQHVTSLIAFSHDIDDDIEQEHELRIILKNKKPEHTAISTDGTIISDALLIVSNLVFDGMNIDQIAAVAATYTHNFNGSQPFTQAAFFGPMGCNGEVSLKFSTPLYLWLLSNM